MVMALAVSSKAHIRFIAWSVHSIIRHPCNLRKADSAQNLVRQFIYRDHWDYSQLPSFSGGEKTRRHHVDHCIATLRTVFTCLSDVTPYVLAESPADGKVKGRGLPHKCRVYQDMVNWVNDHSVFDSIE